MSFFVSRAVTPGGQDRADIFARGDVAVLAVADGAGADLVMEGIRVAVLDAQLDLLTPRAWIVLFSELDRAVAKAGESNVVVVVLSPGMLICAAAGDSEAWIVQPGVVEKLTDGASRARLGSGCVTPRAVARGALEGRLVVASDGLFRHVAESTLRAQLAEAPWAGLADSLLALARLPPGEFSDDVAVLVAER